MGFTRQASQRKMKRPLATQDRGIPRLGAAPHPPWALAIHDDIGALLALAIELQRCHLDLIPARTVPEAREFLGYGGPPPDVLLVNYAIEGAPALATTLRERYPALGVIGISSDADHPCGDAHALLTAELASAQCSIPKWVRIICSVVKESRLRALR